MKPTGVVILRANPIHPDPRVEKIGRVLTGAGYSVRALGWDRAGGLPPVEQEAGFPVQRLELKMPPARGLRNLPALLRWQVALLNWLRRERATYQIIHACDFDTILPALWARRLWGKRVVYDIFDFYADMLRATPEPVRQVVRRLDLALIAQADAVLLADDARYAQITGAHPRRSAVIYNAPEDSGSHALRGNLPRRSASSPDGLDAERPADVPTQSVGTRDAESPPPPPSKGGQEKSLAVDSCPPFEGGGRGGFGSAPLLRRPAASRAWPDPPA